MRLPLGSAMTGPLGPFLETYHRHQTTFCSIYLAEGILTMGAHQPNHLSKMSRAAIFAGLWILAVKQMFALKVPKSVCSINDGHNQERIHSKPTIAPTFQMSIL